MNRASELSERRPSMVSTRDDEIAGDEDDRGDPPDAFRQYRSPQRHGEAFVEPAFNDVAGVLKRNIDLLNSHGESFTSLRHRARHQLIEDALRYTSAYRDTSWLDSCDPAQIASGPILMAGHQPAIFHPGVWFKNFALSRLAETHQAVAVNLVVDNDVASGSSIRVPTIEPVSGEAAYETIRYDSAGGGVPYEQTTITDREMFDSFDRRVKTAVEPLVGEPCITPLWKHARNAIERCGVAGCALAQARHGLEGEVGLRTLEIPQGVVCRTTAFAEFALLILTELPRFHRCYNDAANRYRRAHGIRSTAHPVPNLDEQDGWFEAPLWIYGNDSPQRKPAWVRMSDDHLVISDRGDRELRVDVRFPKLAAEQLASLVSPDFKLRPRALLTTMYARLILSDLFLHGIGGGKYDQLGDMIIRSFFMVSPPEFMVISATIQLPGIARADDSTDVRELQQAIRDTFYHGERFADEVPLDAKLIDRKHQLLASVPPRGNRKAWHNEMSEINASLADQLSERRGQLHTELARARRTAASGALLASREHPFCVFPLEFLTDAYRALLPS